MPQKNCKQDFQLHLLGIPILSTMRKLLIIILLFSVVPDLIIWFQILPSLSIGWKLMVSVPTMLVLCFMPGFDKKRLSYLLRKMFFFALMILLIIPKLVFALVAWPFGWMAGLIAVGCVLCLLVYGFSHGWLKLTAKAETLHFKNLPQSFEGYKIVQISDLHLGSFARHPEMIKRVVELANAQDADLIVFTGDLVNYKAEEADPFIHVLSELKGKDGVISILGNHDYYFMPKVKNREKSIGWRLLFNDHFRISRNNDAIYIIGVEQIGKPPFEPKGQLDKALKGVPHNAFKILLSHDPTHWHVEVSLRNDIPLTLSGHTHAAQMRLGRITPARLIFREWGGKYVKGEQTLYVSQGIGGTIPFRLGAWPELNVFTLRKSQ